MPKAQDIPILNSVEVSDGSYVARTLDYSQKYEMEEALAFRHVIFREELGWSLDDISGQEIDEYDKDAVHFGVFSTVGKLVGYCRLILPESGFMIENKFSDLVDPGYEIRKESDTVEISRFAIPADSRGIDNGFKIIELLLRCVYKWATLNGILYIYGVCATEHLQFVLDFISCCKPIGPAHEYQPGISSSALIFDLGKIDLTEVQILWSIATGKPNPI